MGNYSKPQRIIFKYKKILWMTRITRKKMTLSCLVSSQVRLQTQVSKFKEFTGQENTASTTTNKALYRITLSSGYF